MRHGGLGGGEIGQVGDDPLVQVELAPIDQPHRHRARERLGGRADPEERVTVHGDGVVDVGNPVALDVARPPVDHAQGHTRYAVLSHACPDPGVQFVEERARRSANIARRRRRRRFGHHRGRKAQGRCGRSGGDGPRGRPEELAPSQSVGWLWIHLFSPVGQPGVQRGAEAAVGIPPFYAPRELAHPPKELDSVLGTRFRA